MYRFFKNILVVCLFFTFSISYCQSITLSDQAKVSVITCGTGNELHSLFGHTGIRILDETLGIDLVYNYGAFDFSAPNFYGKFLKGDLLYFIGLDDFNSFLFNYQMSNRSVWEQPLEISLENKQAVFDELASTYGTKKALYTYKFIDKNCTTLAVDLIEKHTDVVFNLNIPGAKGLSNREILNVYLQKNYIPGLGINLVFGTKTDKVFNHIFLPEQLLQAIQLTQYKNQPISNQVISHYEAHAESSSTLFIITGTAVFFIILGFLCMYKWVAYSFYIFIGMLSLFLFGMQFYSLHNEVHYNYNLLLINPLFLLAFFYLLTNQLKKYKTTIKYISYCITIYIGLVIFNGYLFMVFPILLGISLALFIQWKLTK